MITVIIPNGRPSGAADEDGSTDSSAAYPKRQSASGPEVIRGTFVCRNSKKGP